MWQIKAQSGAKFQSRVGSQVFRIALQKPAWIGGGPTEKMQLCGIGAGHQKAALGLPDRLPHGKPEPDFLIAGGKAADIWVWNEGCLIKIFQPFCAGWSGINLNIFNQISFFV
jgi:hypothetical protein